MIIDIQLINSYVYFLDWTEQTGLDLITKILTNGLDHVLIVAIYYTNDYSYSSLCNAVFHRLC